MDNKVRVSANRGCEVRIVLGCKAKVSQVFSRIAGLLHRAQQELIDQGLLWFSL